MTTRSTETHEKYKFELESYIPLGPMQLSVYNVRVLWLLNTNAVSIHSLIQLRWCNRFVRNDGWIYLCCSRKKKVFLSLFILSYSAWNVQLFQSYNWDHRRIIGAKRDFSQTQKLLSIQQKHQPPFLGKYDTSTFEGSRLTSTIN